MSERVVLTRLLEMKRGGMKGNLAGPVFTLEMQNGSGGSVARGDIVIWDRDSSSTADKLSFTTTTTENNPDVVGMVFDSSIASNAFGKIQVYGPTDALKVDGNDDIAIGDYISTFSTAKIGQKTTGAGSFAMALEAYSTNDSSGVVDAFINCLGSSFGGAASVSWYRDNVPLYFGDANDVSIKWNATNLVVLPVADDTGVFMIGDGTTDMDFRVTLGASTDYFEMDVGNKAFEVVGDVRMDFSAATIASANTDGGLIKGGTSSAPITEDTANMKFISFYFDDGATSGEAVGIYDRLYVTGAAGEGIALRAFCSVTDVAAANARGAHISLSFGASGSVTGLGTALETTLHIPSGGGLAGTVSSIKAAINSDGANSDPAGALLSVFDVVNQGNATGMADVDDDAALINLDTGWASATGNMVYTHAITAGAAAGSIKIRVGGTPYYLYYWSTEGS